MTAILDDLEKITKRLTASRIYYLTCRWCLKANEEGEPILFKVPFDDETVWVMHPDLLPQMRGITKQKGLYLMEFDLDRFFKRKWIQSPLWGK